MADFILLTLLLVSVPASSAAVKLAWDANAELDLGGYRVYYGTSPDNYTDSIDFGLATEGVVEGLEPSTEYFFAVTAYNLSGVESEHSEPVAYSTAHVFARQAFAGLVGEIPGGPQGAFTISIGATGAASGVLRLNGKSRVWRGVFDGAGHLTALIQTRAGIVLASLSLDLAADNSTLTGTIETAEGTAAILAHAAAQKGENPSAGRYTMALTPEESALQGGYGFGVVNVSERGVARFAGTIPSGSKFAAAVKLDSAATAPLYISKHQGQSSILGRVLFRDVPNESDADAVLRVRWGSSDEAPVALRAARYSFPSLIGSSAPGSPSGLALFLTQAGFAEVSAGLTGTMTLLGTAASGETLKAKISPRTGLFTGSSLAPGKPRFDFAGALYRKTVLEGFGRGRKARGVVVLKTVLDD